MRKAVLLGFGCLLSFVLPVILSSNAYAEDPENNISEKITSLGRIPEGFNAISDSIKFSPDLRHVTYAAYKDKFQNIVRYDNQTSPVYNAIQQGTPIFSPSGRHAYVAYESGNGDAVVVVDWKPDPVYGKVADFMFSPDGSRYAYRVGKNEKQCIVVDGQNGKWYTGIPVKKNFLFSPDSSHLAYVAYEDNACRLVHDGKEQKDEFAFIEDVTFSPDSRSIAYKGKIKKGAWCVVYNGRKHQSYGQIFSLQFSPDSKQLAYVATQGGKMVLVLNGVEKEIRDQYGLPVFSPDSGSLAYSYRTGKNFFLNVNGKISPAFQQLYKFYYSSDSSRVAYIAGRENSWQCFVDGAVGPKYKLLDVFQFSPDSSRYAYCGVTDEGNGTIIIDGKPQDANLSVGEPYFSPNSKHIVYKRAREKNDNWETVFDGKQIGKTYLSIGKYHFSPDSRHLAYKAQVSPKQAVMVVDGAEQCADIQLALLDEPFFSPDGYHVAYLAADAKDNKYSLVVNGHVLPGQYDGFFLGTPLVFDAPNRFHTLGMREPGPEFLLIEVEIPESIKLTTELKNL